MKNTEKNIRVRFAPSPTGYFHIGSARIALFNFLYAKKCNGTFVLRIEDTDRERSKEEYENDIMRSLKWLGLQWEEGVFENKEKGDFGPYRQSERGKIYKEYVKKLLESGNAYYCFCTKEELEERREKQKTKKEAPRYDGKCFKLSDDEKKKRFAQNKDYVIRLRLPENDTIEFEDLVRGKVKFDSNDIGGDFVIARGDFSPLYNFACSVDDYEMKITHVIRGEDHISNTPKQILVQRALGIPTPDYAHLPLTLGPDKSKLSKRHTAVSLYEYKEKGYLAKGLVNFIAFLGWNPGGEREIYSLEEMINLFSFDKCQRSGAIFNIDKLNYINGYYIRNMDTKELTKLCVPYLLTSNLITLRFEESQYPPAYGGTEVRADYLITEKNESASFEKIKAIVSLYQERMKTLSEISEFADYFFREELDYGKELLFWKEMTKEEIEDSLEKGIEILSGIKEWDIDSIQEKLIEEASKNKDKGRLLWPIRAALSGKKASASPFEIAQVLGPKDTIKRLKTAKMKLKNG